MLPSAAEMPPCAATVCERVGKTLVMQAVRKPASLQPTTARSAVGRVLEAFIKQRAEDHDKSRSKLDRHGKELRIRDAEGLFAQALQHEIDHLDGHLYIDRMDSLDKLQRSEPLRKREADARAARGVDDDEDDTEEEPA